MAYNGLMQSLFSDMNDELQKDYSALTLLVGRQEWHLACKN